MSTLNTQPNFGTPGQTPQRAFSPGDDAYEMLIEAHRGLNDEQSRQLNARLVLLLANHIGDVRVLHQALEAAGDGLLPAAEAPEAKPSNPGTHP